jgi:hypothetical protein
VASISYASGTANDIVLNTVAISTAVPDPTVWLPIVGRLFPRSSSGEGARCAGEAAEGVIHRTRDARQRLGGSHSAFSSEEAEMPLPPKSAPATDANIKALHDALTALIAGHPGAVEPWTFYEALDEYLGPWGGSGYPISYGKYYCIAFNQNEKLQRNPQTREWVRATTVALQEPLRDFIVERFRAGTLSSLTEAELRAFAFSVHPRAYVQGGLTLVTLTAPEMVPIIATIPAAQFSPASENFAATVKQVLSTLEMVIPQAAGMTIAAMMPVHSGLLATAARRDAQGFQRDAALTRWLTDARRRLDAGELDQLSLLNQLTARLNATQFKDQGMAMAARQVVQAADARKRSLAAYYREQLSRNPGLRPSIDRLQPGWQEW